MPPHEDEDTSSLQKARERLYTPDGNLVKQRAPFSKPSDNPLQHQWGEEPLPAHVETLSRGRQHVRIAGIFLVAAFVFFIASLGIAAYFFFSGGNSVSVDKISVDIQGPTTIAGGDTVPLSVTITNKNPSAVSNLTLEIDFPDGTRSVDDVLKPYPRYIENLGTIASGATVTRSIKAVVFGGAGQALILPVSLSFGTAGSSATFVKKSSYALAVSSTPLSLSVDALSEAVSGSPLAFTLTVRSNATVPISNVVLSGAFPFGFSVTSSSVPITNSSFLLGTIRPGDTKTVTLTGVLQGQSGEQRVFNFMLGTAKSTSDSTLAVTYMTQSAPVTIAEPFINTTLTLNGDTNPNSVVNPGSSQNVSVSYTNTLTTSVTNAVVTITISGSAVDYNTIRSMGGFYNSADHTIVFSKDTDPSLALLAPGASGVGAFTLSTLPAGALPPSPSIIFTVSVSGTRIGQSSVPENVTSTMTKTARVATSLALSAYSLHASGSFTNTGSIPPKANFPTTYTIVWDIQNTGNAVAGGVLKATLPSYVTFTGQTSSNAITYDNGSRTVTWNTGDLSQGGSAQGSFQVSLTPSTSQKGTAPQLTSITNFSGHDRYANIDITSKANPVTTETVKDPGYINTNGLVQ